MISDGYNPSAYLCASLLDASVAANDDAGVARSAGWLAALGGGLDRGTLQAALDVAVSTGGGSGRRRRRRRRKGQGQTGTAASVGKIGKGQLQSGRGGGGGGQGGQG